MPACLRCIVVLALLASPAPDALAAAPAPSIPADADEPYRQPVVRKGNVLAVPIPTSDPTIGSGLIGVAGYFWGQTEAQAAAQPPSVTGIGALYTDTQSWAVAVGQSLYWDRDRWRLKAALGTASLELPLTAVDTQEGQVRLDWELAGELFFFELSRAIKGPWYAGLSGRYLNFDQTFSVSVGSPLFELAEVVEVASLGPVFQRDTRDSTTYPRDGSLFRAGGMYSWKGRADDDTYRSLDLAFSSYHQVMDNVVLAWRAQSCWREDGVPLWDACRVALRGFPATSYLGRESDMAEIEARWQWSERWGAVAFAGAGRIEESISVLSGADTIPSFGVGLRLLVQKAQHINLRLDYAWSDEDEALYFFVGEAF